MAKQSSSYEFLHLKYRLIYLLCLTHFGTNGQAIDAKVFNILKENGFVYKKVGDVVI